MRRNVAGQFVGCQLIAKADGTPITTGTTTVYVTGDAGTQGAGSVGSGACTHEGQGFWTYAPANTETNYTHVAFTFVNTNAINVTVQIYPIAYDASGQMTGVTVATSGIAAASFAAGAINAAAIADAAIDAATFAAGAITATVIADGAIDAATFAAGAITATVIATGAIDADALAADTITAAKVAADVSTEIAAAVAAPSAATISAAVWDLDATTHQTTGTFGQAIGDPGADTHTIYDAVVTAAAGVNIAADIIAIKAETATIVTDTNELQTDWTNGGRLDLILDIIAADTTTDIPATISTLQTAVNDIPTNAELATALGTADDATLAAIAALNDLSTTEVEDAVWDAVMANHLDVGSTGAALSAAGAAGDPWITPIPGVYIAGQAGYVVGTTLVDELAKVPKSDGSVTFNVTCVGDIKSGLSTQAELNKVPKSDSNVTWNATALASIQTEANDAIVANRLDELLAADSDIDGAAPPTVGSVFHELMTKTAGSFTYDQASDSLEAIRDRGDAAWTTATGFSTFDPTSDPVLLADGAHGGSSTTITAKSISVVNSDNAGVAVNIQGTGTGNSHGINLSSVNGKAFAIGAVGNAVSIDSSAANGLVVTGATGDIVADITGAISSVGNIADAVWDEANGDHLGAGSTGLALSSASAPTAGAVADAVWEEAIADHSGTVGSTAAKLAASSSQTSVDDLPTNGELATALGTADDAILLELAKVPKSDSNVTWNATALASIQAEATDALNAYDGPTNAELTTALGDIPTAIENADALLNRDMSTGTDSGSATVRTARQALRFLRNKWGPDGLGNIKVYKEDDATESWKFVPTATPGASPITETDPEGP